MSTTIYIQKSKPMAQAEIALNEMRKNTEERGFRLTSYNNI